MATTYLRLRKALFALPLALAGFGLLTPLANADTTKERGRQLQDAETGEYRCACSNWNPNCDC